jgi:hypothetical protein
MPPSLAAKMAAATFSDRLSSSVGAAYSGDVAPTELGSFWNRQTTKMSALTGFSKNGESFAVPLKIRAPGFAGY